MSARVNKSSPKSQHFIPRLHLAYFAGQKGQVRTYNKNTGAVWSAIPEETAVHTHFYSIEREDGSYDTTLEETRAKIESNAAPVYKRLIGGDIPTKKDVDRGHFAQFLATMFTRTPAMRRDAGEMAGRSIQIQNYATGIHDGAFATMIRQIEEQDGQKLSDEQKESLRKGLIDPSAYRIELGKEWTLSAIAGADKLALIFFDMEWCVMELAHGFFITSDNPVTRYNDPKSRHPIYGDHGFMNKNVMVTFPLTTNKILLLGWKETGPRIVGQQQHAVAMNQLRAQDAEEFLYAHIEHKIIRDMAIVSRNSRPRMTTQGFGPEKFAEIVVKRRRTRDRRS